VRLDHLLSKETVRHTNKWCFEEFLFLDIV